MKHRTFAIASTLSFSVLATPPTLAGLNDGLMAHYPFDGNAQDASPNGNHGTVQGATLTADRFGQANSAYYFDGQDDSITVPSSASLNPTNQLSIIFWIKIYGITGAWSPVIFKGGKWTGNGQYRAYTVWLNKQPAFYLVTAGNQSEQHVLKSGTVKGGEWLFYTAVIDRRNHSMTVYLNGEQDQQMVDSYSSFNNNNNDLVFGGLAEGRAEFSPFQGVLDEVRFYNRALSAAEIQALYTEKPPVVDEPGVKAEKPPVVDEPGVKALGENLLEKPPEIEAPVGCSASSDVNIGMTFSAKFPDKEGKYYIIPAEVVESIIKAIDIGTILVINKPPACQPSGE